MYCLEKYRQKVRIDLTPGVYLFSGASATGKTALATWLSKFSRYGERACSYTYNDYKQSLLIERVLNPDKYDVVVLDRYDLYYGLGAEEIVACADKMIILIDCKRHFTLAPYERARIALFQDKIEVS